MKNAVLILAAGKGNRMKVEIPKVLVTLHGKPLIKYLLDTIDSIFQKSDIHVVVGYKKDEVKSALLNEYNFIEQTEQLGTGHAVMCAKESSINKFDNILVLYGDMPFISKQTINEILIKHSEKMADLTMATISVDNFNSWQSCFYDFGRIVRDKNNNPIKIVEKKDATEEELKIKEVNPSYFCFKSEWLWEKITEIRQNNSQKEYYLTDLLSL
ncbi:bifunctional UDP-N-acetylglucosamine diphosphorylase/glucosamine-1-phosphate N-acetyltransferase GlmU, partial [candidate division WWE3 bacterium CG_4_9_14_0_2_um_filter_35_11]